MWLWANDITTAWRGVPNGTLSMMHLLSKFDVSSFSVIGDTEISNWLFCWLWAVQRWYLFFLFWASQNCPYLLFFADYGQVIVTLFSLGKTCHEKQSKPSLFDKNSRTMHRIWHKLFSTIQSVEIKNWFPQSVNRLYMFNLLFLSVTCFFWFLL